MIGVEIQLANGQTIRFTTESLVVKRPRDRVEFHADNNRKLEVQKTMLVYWEQGPADA